MISTGWNSALKGAHHRDNHPVVVTAAINGCDLQTYERQRRPHLPRERNFIGAHRTIFHALPGGCFKHVLDVLHRFTWRREATIDVVGLRLPGAGVAFVIESDELQSLRAGLRTEFEPWLTRQDAQGWQPHITVQNKVAPEAALRLHAVLLSQFKHDQLRLEGPDAWSNVGGPWRPIASLPSGHTMASA